LEQLPPEGLTEQSACADWKVYQVVSHLGSGPEINGARLESVLRGAPPQTDEQRKAIWDRWDSRKPDEMLPAFRQANDDYFELLDSLGDDELGRVVPWFVGPVPVATALALRLNEQALHAWDIRWARDRQAGLTPEAVPDLLQVNLQSAWLGNLVKPERAGQLAGKSIQFVYSRPEGAVNLRFEGDGVGVSPDLAAAPDLAVELPAEALMRLVWGRYDVRAGLRAGDLKLSRPELAEPLQALFPGR
jgi:uncharacterized protein (TIGR03083 family)